jgi:hypothetical protein
LFVIVIVFEAAAEWKAESARKFKRPKSSIIITKYSHHLSNFLMDSDFDDSSKNS